jgi:hypothetical protein
MGAGDLVWDSRQGKFVPDTGVVLAGSYRGSQDPGTVLTEAAKAGRAAKIKQAQDDAWWQSNKRWNAQTGQWEDSRDRAPIGVPDNYIYFAQPVAGQTPQALRSTQIVQPRYRQGDQWSINQQWDVNKTRDWQDFLLAYATGAGMDEFQKAINVPGVWGAAEAQVTASVMAFANEKGLTLDQARAYIESLMQSNPEGWAGALGLDGMGTSGGAGGMDPDGTTTDSQTTVNLTSKAEGRQLLDQYLRQMYGRGVTEAELNGYIRSLNAQERSNPSTSTSTTVTTGDGANRDTTTTQTPSEVDPLALADQRFDTPEKQAYQEQRFLGVLAGMVGLG